MTDRDQERINEPAPPWPDLRSRRMTDSRAAGEDEGGGSMTNQMLDTHRRMLGMGDETQETISRWAEATFPGGDPASPRTAVRVLEEVFELCLAAGASYDEIDATVTRLIEKDAFRRDPELFRRGEGWIGMDPEPQPDKVPVEAADVLITLYVLAGRMGFDLHSETDRKQAVNRRRRWAARGDGTGYHIKETVHDAGPPDPAPAGPDAASTATREVPDA